MTRAYVKRKVWGPKRPRRCLKLAKLDAAAADLDRRRRIGDLDGPLSAEDFALRIEDQTQSFAEVEVKRPPRPSNREYMRAWRLRTGRTKKHRAP